MRSSVSGRLFRSLGVLLLVGAAISATSASTLAAEQITQTGTIGDVYFNDTSAHPGAICFYNGAAGTLYFDGVKVKSFKVQWPDQVNNVTEHGWVAYRVQIQHWDGASWSVVKHSGPIRIKAWDNQQTAFAARTLSWGGPDNHSFRAGVSLKWIKSNGSVWGRSTYFLDWHRLAYDGSVAATCPGRHVNVPG